MDFKENFSIVTVTEALIFNKQPKFSVSELGFEPKSSKTFEIFREYGGENPYSTAENLLQTQYCSARGKRFLKSFVHLTQIIFVQSIMLCIWDTPAIDFEMMKTRI